jgi:hypothetical protein
MSKVREQHLLRAQMRIKNQADKKRSEVQFSMVDKVFLKLQPYIQSSLAQQPYTIAENVSTFAYKLGLPVGNVVHLVFHVSELK